MGSTTTDQVTYLLEMKSVTLCVMGSTTTTNHWVSYTLLMGSYNYNLITEVSYTLCDGFHNYNQSLGQLHSVDGFLQLQLDH